MDYKLDRRKKRIYTGNDFAKARRRRDEMRR